MYNRPMHESVFGLILLPEFIAFWPETLVQANILSSTVFTVTVHQSLLLFDEGFSRGNI